jgi:hypothetical protein
LSQQGTAWNGVERGDDKMYVLAERFGIQGYFDFILTSPPVIPQTALAHI